MFSLEQSIAEWRRQMLAAGIKTPVPMEELECHLREEIERQMKSGLNEQKAFEVSVQRIGQPKMLNSEFKNSERTFMKRTLIILVGILGVLIGTAIILPALALYNHEGTMVHSYPYSAAPWQSPLAFHNAKVGFLIGIPIALIGISTAFYGFKKRNA